MSPFASCAGVGGWVQVLEQETAFDGLQWFQSVDSHYEAEAAEVAQRSPANSPLQVAVAPATLPSCVQEDLQWFLD